MAAALAAALAAAAAARGAGGGGAKCGAVAPSAGGGWRLFAGDVAGRGVPTGAADASTAGLGAGGDGRRGRRARAQRQGGDGASGAFGWGLLGLKAPDKKWRRKPLPKRKGAFSPKGPQPIKSPRCAGPP